MRTFFIALTLALSLACAPPAAAQNLTDSSTATANETTISTPTLTATSTPTPNSSTPAPARTDEDTVPAEVDPRAGPCGGATIQVDDVVVICDSRLEDGEAVITLESSRATRMTLSDAGGFFEEGPVSERTVTADGEVTVRMDVTVDDGLAGVGIDTGRVTYSHVIEDDRATLPGGPRAVDMIYVGGTVFSFFLVGLPATWYYIRHRRGGVDYAF